LSLSEQQYFVWDTAFQKHQMTRYARNLGEHAGPSRCGAQCKTWAWGPM